MEEEAKQGKTIQDQLLKAAISGAPSSWVRDLQKMKRFFYSKIFTR